MGIQTLKRELSETNALSQIKQETEQLETGSAVFAPSTRESKAERLGTTVDALKEAAEAPAEMKKPVSLEDKNASTEFSSPPE